MILTVRDRRFTIERMNLLPELAAYIPHDRVENIVYGEPEAASGRPLPSDGVAMIADISGFTPLTEALTHGLSADHGAEELTRALDSVFTPLIAQVHRYRGSVIKFGGDALIIWFGREKGVKRTAVIRRALTAAWRMQQVMGQYGQILTPIGPVTLRMKIGLTYGPVKRFNLGIPEIGFEDVLAGATLDRMAENEHHAEPGDIMVDAATLAYVPEVQVVTWRDGVAVVGKVARPSRSKPWPALTFTESGENVAEKLAAYVPRPIVETLQAGQTQVAELKPVISLFVQFHGLDYDKDPGITNKLQSYFSLAQEVVGRYDGRLNRLITGDKGSLLHIIFGAPRSVEEQEHRAIRCALDLQTECGSLPFITRQRIGVSGGRVFAGPVGSPARHDYTTMGDAINLSARLMQHAKDNQVLLDTAVRSQLSPAFTVTDLGYIQVKGKADPIHVYAATGYQPPERQVRRVEKLVGRERELAVISKQLTVISKQLTVNSEQLTVNDGRSVREQSATHYVLRTTGHIITIIGEVGLGKTLLLDNVRYEAETAWRADPGGGVWASGISLAYGNTFTGYLFIELLRDLLNVPTGATPHQTAQRLHHFCEELFGGARLESVYPYLAKFMNLPLPDELAARLEGLAGESLRWQLFELVPELLRLLCGRYPVVLALDDLQWADPTSLQLIERLAPLTAELPLILLLAMRPEPEARAWQMVWGWDTAEATASVALPLTHLTLAPLDDTAAATLIRQHAPDLPERVVDYLVAKGGGNPLFLVELVRTLQLTADADFARLELDALDLPNSVQGLLLAQLDRLAVETRHTLQLAAVIGKTFLDRVLASISTAEQQITHLLAELEERDYIRPDHADLGDAHTFRHALIQEGAYSTLLHERRRAYHRQVAAVFEQLFPAALAEQVAFLAYHWEQAEELDNAIYYLSQTADQSRLLSANEEAELLYHKILSMLDQKETAEGISTTEQQAKIYLKLAQIRSNTLDFLKAQDYYELAFNFLEQARLTRQNPGTLTPVEERVFRWGILEKYAHFDPAKADVRETSQLLANVFEGLVEVDDDWNLIPAVAQRWQVLEGGRQYLFRLRPNLQWSDGRPLTAHDFVFAWLRNLDPKTGANLAYQLYLIEGAEAFHQGNTADPTSVSIKAEDELTLRITLQTPSHYFLYLLADPITYPQPAHIIRQASNMWSEPQNLVCNGPFKVEKGRADEVWLARNPYYQRFMPGNLEKIALQFVHPGFEAYVDGRIDWCRVDDRADLFTDYPTEGYLVQDLMTFILGFACHCPPFDKPALRQAFAQSIDKKALVQSVWGGVQRAAMGGMVPPGMVGHSPEISLAFDAVNAKKLLEISESDSPTAFPTIHLVSPPGFNRTPTFLAENWRRHLGVEVVVSENITSSEAMALIQQGSAQMILMGIGLDYPDPNDILSVAGQAESPFSALGWDSKQFSTLIEQAAYMADHQKRLNLYHQADRVLVRQETAMVPLYYLQAYGLLRSGFKLTSSSKIIRGDIKLKNVVME
jgi:ABC-type oligopeptide transport system substrate-binding subunit/class 3 adenylate cyclase